jgi:AAA+ superfamily predicted ATPase
LTAESLSEKLRCPLWCLSISELGITPATLETMLLRVMDVAASWGALLLLDEADIFLERRTTSDLTRNAMTGVFLRQLEYYRGVLFLTTNRDLAFDDAMCSRISLFLYYEKHDEDQRKTIWTRMLERVGLDGTPNELAEFAKPQLNGREIRNIMKTAHTLSRSKNDGEKLEINHVMKALKVYEASMKVWRRDHEQIALDST